MRPKQGEREETSIAACMCQRYVVLCSRINRVRDMLESNRTNKQGQSNRDAKQGTVKLSKRKSQEKENSRRYGQVSHMNQSPGDPGSWK